MKSNAALIVIDMQTALVTGAYEETAVIDAINTVIRKARDHGVPVVFVQHNSAAFPPLMKGAEGWSIHADLEQEPGDLVIEKEASDAFYRTELEQQLRALGATVIAVTGMQTEYCVDATCRSALSKDFDVVLVADGHSTGPSHLTAPEIIQHHNALLPNLAHPSASLRVCRASELAFDDWPGAAQP